MDKYLDKESKTILLLIIGFNIFFYFILPKIGPYLQTWDAESVAENITKKKNEPKVTPIDQKKNYTAEVETNQGNFTIDLFEQQAPTNVSNFVGNKTAYNNSKITDIQKNFLFKIDTPNDPQGKVNDEINADFLGLDQRKVKDSEFLKTQYNSEDKTTKPFAPENLDKYEDQSLKIFYEKELGYKYNKDLSTPKAKKYTVYFANKGANTNGLDFFILMSDSVLQIDGRYTPIGQITHGFDILDKINDSQPGTELTVKQVKIITEE